LIRVTWCVTDSVGIADCRLPIAESAGVAGLADVASFGVSGGPAANAAAANENHAHKANIVAAVVRRFGMLCSLLEE
jgi:hypothetical protein